MKLLILAIDALDWSLFNKLNCTPFLSFLQMNGLSGELISPEIPLTPASFYEFYLGKSLHLSQNIPDKQLVLTLGDMDISHTIYDDIKRSYKSAIFEMPFLGQLRDLGEVFVSGITWKTEKIREYNQEHRVYPLSFKKYVDGFHYYGSYPTDIFDMENNQILERERLSYIYQILRDCPCEIISIYSRIIDSACHSITKDHVKNKELVQEKLIDLYSFIDTWINVLITEIVKPNIILIFSDHGFNPLEKQGKDWQGHSRHGTYILCGSMMWTGTKTFRTYQVNWIIRDILGINIKNL